MTRELSPRIGQCELTHISRQPINFPLASLQHREYVECLTNLGCEVHRLPTDPELPDSVFIEDTCVVLDELAVITRPGAESRRAETATVAEAMKEFRELRFIESPGTLDGGDVLRVGRRLFVGRSSRTNDAGIEQFREFVTPFGYTVTAEPLVGCLHLKSAATTIRDGLILANREWVDPGIFGAAAVIEVDPSEPTAANALLIGETVVYPAEFPATRRRMEDAGINVVVVEMSEFAKAEGGVTCCSLIFSP
jgi:dimethylargininase